MNLNTRAVVLVDALYGIKAKGGNKIMEYNVHTYAYLYLCIFCSIYKTKKK